MPKLWQSLRSCWAIAVKALTTMTVDPIVKKTFSMMFCVFVQTRRHEEASHQHGKGLPIARWQSSHDVTSFLVVDGASDDVCL